MMPEEQPAQSWNSHAVASFNGAHDSCVKTGEDYQTTTLAELFTMEPGSRPKGSGLAFIPSTYADYDAREHAAQRDRGAYVSLTGDIDSGNHAPKKIQLAVEAFAGEAAYLIYTSPHARPGELRWRIVLPLDTAVPFAAWHDAQCAFFAFMDAQGIEMDHALARAAQPVYAPNVPPIHAKTGTALRGPASRAATGPASSTTSTLPTAWRPCSKCAAMSNRRARPRTGAPRTRPAKPMQPASSARNGSACRGAIRRRGSVRRASRAASAMPTIFTSTTSTAGITSPPIARSMPSSGAAT